MIKCAAEFAPGIPAKERIVEIPTVQKPTTWKFGLQLHEAEKAGKHFDLRIGDPAGHAHSWALRQLPNPGEKMLAVQQPTHTVEYMPFKGEIPAGYGKGLVHSVRFEPTEVIKSDPNRITFHLHRGHQNEEMTLVRLKEKDWLLVNHTITRKSKPSIPSSKPGYREIPFEKVPERLDRTDEIMAAKIDGGHNTFMLETGKPVRIFSYRPTERDTGVIEHTHKIPKALSSKVPSSLNGTILRGELYAQNLHDTAPLPAEIIGGMLNANTWLSREKQKVHGHLRAAIFDVVMHRGKLMENAPYAEKLKILREVKNTFPWMELPDMAKSPEAKAKLLATIVSGKHPQTREGVVFWNTEKSGPPTKAKVTSDHDVIIKGFTPGEGELVGKGIGAIQYGDPKHPKDIKGKVGTGMSQSLRQDMLEHPENYVGKLMKLKAQGVFPSGALRAPRFLNMHIDSLTGGEKVAAMRDELEKISLPKWQQLLRMGKLGPGATATMGIKRTEAPFLQKVFKDRPGITNTENITRRVKARLVGGQPLTTRQHKLQDLASRSAIAHTPNVVNTGAAPSGATLAKTIGGYSPGGFLRGQLYRRTKEGPLETSIAEALNKGPLRSGTILVPEPGKGGLKKLIDTEHPLAHRGVLAHELGERALMGSGKKDIIPSRGGRATGQHRGAKPLLAEMQHMSQDPKLYRHWQKVRRSTGEGITMRKWKQFGGTPGHPLATGGRAESHFDKVIRPYYGRMAADIVKRGPIEEGLQAAGAEGGPGRISYLAQRAKKYMGSLAGSKKKPVEATRFNTRKLKSFHKQLGVTDTVLQGAEQQLGGKA